MTTTSRSHGASSPSHPQPESLSPQSTISGLKPLAQHFRESTNASKPPGPKYQTPIPNPAAGEGGAIVAAVPPHALAQLETSKWISLVEVLSGAEEQPPPPVPARRGARGRSEQLVRPFIGFALASVQVIAARLSPITLPRPPWRWAVEILGI